MTIATITQIVESAAVKMIRIFSGGSYMDLTQGHPVFSPALGRKISVDSLRTGMSLLALSGLLLTVDSVAAVHYPTPVYDLQTDAGRGYFAGVEELLVSSNQCNLYLSGRNFNASQIETIEEAVSTSIEAFISDLESSTDLLDFFREASGNVLRGRAEAWKLLHTLGEVRKTERLELQKVLSYLEQTNISQEDFIVLYHAEPNKSQFFKRCKVVDNIDFLRPFRWFDAFRVDKPKVLILGEGNFSFSKSIVPNLPQINRSNLLATELRSYEELLNATNIDNAQLNEALSYLANNGIEVRFGIDGTNLPVDMGNFDVVVFNFPWVNNPGSSLASTRQMLEGVISQMNNRLNPGGKLFVSHKDYWAAPNKLDFASLANGSNLNLIGDKKFSPQEFPNYSHVVTNPDGTTANVTTGVTFIFGKTSVE